MKIRNILYIFLMVIFTLFAYLLFDRGLNVRTKKLVNYQEDSDLIYKVYLHENDIYDKEYLNMNERYVSKLVDKISVEFNYDCLFNKDINGYYSYQVIGTLVAYQDDITDSLWKKEYKLLDLNVNTLDANNVREIKIDDNFDIDYDIFREELDRFKEKYNIDISGYLDVTIKIKDNLEVSKVNNVGEKNKEISMIIPVSYDSFKISVNNKKHDVGSYYEYSKREKVNYLLLVLGAFSLSLGLSFLALTIRNMVIASKGEFNYKKELNKIMEEHSDIIVEVKRFYNKKKYNLVYVNSFKELMDAYQRIGNPISFREVKKGEEAIFLMTEEDNAWIYRMVSK